MENIIVILVLVIFSKLYYMCKKLYDDLRNLEKHKIRTSEFILINKNNSMKV